MQVVNNKNTFRYEMALDDGENAYLEYRWKKGDMVLMHTLVPKGHRGNGYAAMLVKYVFEDLRSKGLKAIVYCPFVTAYLKKHPEYNDVVRLAD